MRVPSCQNAIKWSVLWPVWALKANQYLQPICYGVNRNCENGSKFWTPPKVHLKKKPILREEFFGKYPVSLEAALEKAS
ncbi:hypothetical protein EBR03_06245 [bacterium]|nr:hypothetical protein [bacterium]